MRLAFVFIAIAGTLLFVAKEKPRPPTVKPLAGHARVVNTNAPKPILIDLTTDSDSLIIQVSSWAKNDPEATAAWTRDLTDLSIREQVVSTVATAWADQDPIRAAKFLLESVPAGQIQENAVMGILQRLAFKDSDAANEWVAKFPDGIRERAEAELARIQQRRFAVKE